MIQQRKNTTAQQRIIAVISGKGGCAKSTPALALAAIAARRLLRIAAAATEILVPIVAEQLATRTAE